MTPFKPYPGTEFYLSGERFCVDSYNREKAFVVAANSSGALVTLPLDELVFHPDLKTADARRPVLNLAGDYDEHQKKVAALKLAEAREAITGFRSGKASDALPNEPRPQYNPLATTQISRLQAKEAELDTPSNRELGLHMSVGTLKRVGRELKAGNAVAFALGKHRPRRSNGRRRMRGFETTAHEVITNRKRSSTTTQETLYFETLRLARTRAGSKWDESKKPSFPTWRRWAFDHYTKSQLTGRASTRKSATEIPEGGFDPERLTRIGQLVYGDTNSLDVLLKGTALEGVVRGSLVVAIDGYSWSCCALRVVEQSETAVDVALTLLDIARPVAMHPDWDSDYQWPYTSLPEHMVATVGGVKLVAGIPVLNPEAVSIDHGNTYKSNKVRDLLERHEIDLLPPRVYSGSDKHPVERFFGAARTMLFEKLDGYRGSNTAERGEDTEESVEWTAQSLEDLLLRWVILGWQTHVMDGHKPPWCPEGEWSPNDLYQHGLKTTGFIPRVMTADDYYATQRVVQVKVHGRGVNVNGLWYNDPLLDPWREQPAPTGSKKWTVYVDDRDRRTVTWVDPEGKTHSLRWGGMSGELPAFSVRHVQALRRREGNLQRHRSRDLLEVMLTKILPIPGDDGTWSKNDRKAIAAASRHQRELDLAARDRARFGVDSPLSPDPTSRNGLGLDAASTSPLELETADTSQARSDPATERRRKHQQSVEDARRQRRDAAADGDEVAPASTLGSRRTSFFSGYEDDTDEEGVA